jgi:hypothetical protein
MSATTDTLFTPLTIATAPEASRPMLEKVQKSLGFIPNLMAVFANAPPSIRRVSRLGRCLREELLHTKRKADYPAGCECREPLQLLRSCTFTNSKNPPTYPRGSHRGSSQQYARSRRQAQCARGIGERTCARTRLCQRAQHSEVPGRGLQKGAGDGASARHRAEDHQQLPRPHFPNAA